MITLYQPSGAWGLSSVSPFCIKLETWLKMAGIPYRVAVANPMAAPKKKVPYIETDGQQIGDSQLIIAMLTERHGVRLDAGLSADALARALAVRRMLEEGAYWFIVQARWGTASGWPHTRAAFLNILPPVIGNLIVPLLRRDILKSLYSQGTGRHTEAELDALAGADVDALAALLGDRPFFLGDEPTSVDAAVHAFVVSVLAFPGQSGLKTAMLSHANLVAYGARMDARFWSQRLR
jgi:glutathione S-transferase